MSYTPEALSKAMEEAALTGCKRDAAVKYKIPYYTLLRKIKKKNEEEDLIKPE